ncbi:MAG: TetM/TetW/TetO/TetS family tetracycline resistance ribosomal protection protein [Lachnospiraceae bacterium]|nr:TetM/TetW/TetO/TetS family tetracycline resistance ribosomal protection protein [Lachnospiraceae bacterium]
MGVQTEEKKPEKHICVGLLAHVDAGKTTLSESMLYLSGSIKKAGRVDNGDAFLDTFALEKTRGITIFSKQAVFMLGDTRITLLDTPGHVDFSAEMERTLQVLDAAILVISGADGVQGHTETLWRLLERYEIPTFLFVNKMDQQGTDRAALLQDIQGHFGDHCVDFPYEVSGADDINGRDHIGGIDKGSSIRTQEMQEAIAMCDEELLEQFLEEGRIEVSQIRQLIRERRLFPCYFGSALKMSGVEALMEGIRTYVETPVYGDSFGAKVFKIARDEQGNRLTYMKVTGGSLKVRDTLQGISQLDNTNWEEKVNQIRMYSGAKYDTCNEASAGTICAVTGLSRTYPGEALGVETASELPLLEPVLQYRVLLPPEWEAKRALLQLRQLEEEEPELHILWEEKLQEIQVQFMGEVQIEVLKSLIWERFHIEVSFGTGRIVYKETIAEATEGIGHFEPLRHYAEVHLFMEPGEPGSGMQYALNCSEDLLDRNWQRLILTHLEEKEHRGVLTGSVITDMKITVIAGKAHQKHTEGGDFRQATYRAVRQGLMETENVLLEPYYKFRMELPTEMVGRAMSDIEKRAGTFQTPESYRDTSVLTGIVPVSTMGDYQITFTSYTRGKGKLQCVLHGYYPCHNTQEVLEESTYDPELDLAHPTGSVFCAHGAGYVVPWYEVPEYAHVQTDIRNRSRNDQEEALQQASQRAERMAKQGRNANAVLTGVTEEELQEIFARTFHANRKKDRTNSFKKTIRPSANAGNPGEYTGSNGGKKENQDGDRWNQAGWNRTAGNQNNSMDEYLLVDGYNVIFAWEDLSALAKDNLHGARTKLMDILCDYQGYKKCHLILVFDAYRVEGHKAETSAYHNIDVVYTAHAETADQYIEKLAHSMGRKYKVTVATSDGLEQVIIRGQGCLLLSARDLKVEIERQKTHIRETYMERTEKSGNYLMDHASDEVMDALS